LRKYLCDEFFRKIADLDKLYAKFYKFKIGKKNNNCNLADCVKVYQLILNFGNLISFIGKLDSNAYSQEDEKLK
jgi:DNA mismatch repair protein MSH2